MTLGTFWVRSSTAHHCSITTGRRDSGLTRANAVERGDKNRTRMTACESWGSEGRSMTQKVGAHVMARAQRALLKAHGGMAKAALTTDVA